MTRMQLINADISLVDPCESAASASSAYLLTNAFMRVLLLGSSNLLKSQKWRLNPKQFSP